MAAICIPAAEPSDLAEVATVAPTERRGRGVRRYRLDRATRYRRRRLVALVVASLMLVTAAGSVTASLPSGGTEAPDAGPSGARGIRGLAEGQVYVVQPGDTLWTIAAELAPGRDVRPVVDRLRASHGGSALQVGDRLYIEP